MQVESLGGEITNINGYISQFVGLSGAIMAILLAKFLQKHHPGIPGIMLYLTVILPFMVGGFNTYTSMLTIIILAANLVLVINKAKKLRFCCNLNICAVISLVIGYCITPLWASDRGMAVLGIVRFISLLLLVITFMQFSPEQKDACLSLIPLSGVVMTLLSLIFALIPTTQPEVTVNGRLAGFFQYPNTYAAFLLAGIIQNYTKEALRKTDHIFGFFLILGIFLSGSKTGFILLGMVLVCITVIQKKYKLVMTLTVFVILGIVLALGISEIDALYQANRFSSITLSAKTLLVRLLYYKDAIRVIRKNPFGYGYWGYAALKGSFQTGSYDVTYIHNGLLQLLFEIGWIPSLLLCCAFGKAIFCKQLHPRFKLLLVILLAHSLLDFDLQFFSIWVILLACLDYENGKETWLSIKANTLQCIIAIPLSVCIWLGTSDLLFQTGRINACLRITPFHTEALHVLLQSASDVETQDMLADRILELRPTDSFAYSAKANAAFAHGDVVEMISYKEQAIKYHPYSIEEYIDYFDKLYFAMQFYLQSGDVSSAGYCRGKLLEIPEMIRHTMQTSDPLAFVTEEESYLVLPDAYVMILQSLM